MIYKFRTMKSHAPELPSRDLPDDEYVSRFGRFLRRTGIDELPQLINIIKGDMSIVGPRPPLPCEVAEYTDYERQRLYVRPGLTCYWQVQPRRNDLSFDQWLELDLRYIRERSFLTDWKIILKTFRAVIGMEGE